jgi:hypothetical protein
MSHFATLVLLSLEEHPGLRPGSPLFMPTVETLVETALAPYDENKQVEPYETACSCVGSVARCDATARATATCGTLKDPRTSFWKDRPQGETEDEQDAAWKTHIAAHEKVEQEVFASHPMKDKPDLECGFYLGKHWQEQIDLGKLAPELWGQRYQDGSGCGGTGVYTTTYNPLSKWDWWCIGGRWQGELDVGYDATKVPENYETCSVCRGTGRRDDDLEREARAKDPSYTCNGCAGTGKALKWNSRWVRHDEGNVRFVRDLFDADGKCLFVPFAIVTPGGCRAFDAEKIKSRMAKVAALADRGVGGERENARRKLDELQARYMPDSSTTALAVADDPAAHWHERGHMGWWAIVTDEKADWEERATSLLAAHEDCLAVLCDLHI